MSINEPTKYDYFFYSVGARLNEGFIDYWKQTADETEHQETMDSLDDTSDANKTGRSIGWYLAGMAESLVSVIVKTGNFVVMFFVTVGLGLNLAILRNEGEKLEERKTRFLVATLFLADNLLAIGIDTIGILCPPAAYKIHALVKENMMAAAFEKLGIISDRTDYGFQSFYDAFKVARNGNSD